MRAPPLAARGGVGGGTERRPEWRCAPCGTSNWLDRPCCRACGKAKGTPKAAPQGPNAAGATSTKDQNTEKKEKDGEGKLAAPAAPAAGLGRGRPDCYSCCSSFGRR